jgi:hypothetical protein
MELSFRPAALTKYPLAQKCRSKKLRILTPFPRAGWIAHLSLMNPATCGTAHFGGIEIVMWK